MNKRDRYLIVKALTFYINTNEGYANEFDKKIIIEMKNTLGKIKLL